ncbi:hypothetical protein ACHAXS_013561, partial [Conticribra weissflogii]
MAMMLFRCCGASPIARELENSVPTSRCVRVLLMSITVGGAHKIDLLLAAFTMAPTMNVHYTSSSQHGQNKPNMGTAVQGRIKTKRSIKTALAVGIQPEIHPKSNPTFLYSITENDVEKDDNDLPIEEEFEDMSWTVTSTKTKENHPRFSSSTAPSNRVKPFWEKNGVGNDLWSKLPNQDKSTFANLSIEEEFDDMSWSVTSTKTKENHPRFSSSTAPSNRVKPFWEKNGVGNDASSKLPNQDKSKFANLSIEEEFDDISWSVTSKKTKENHPRFSSSTAPSNRVKPFWEKNGVGNDVW